MENKLAFIEKFQEDEIIQESKQKNYFVAKLDGDKIPTLFDYMNAIFTEFKIPWDVNSYFDNFDAYSDFMRDLDWTGMDHYDGYIIIIEHYDKMMEKDYENKRIILYYFLEIILPFWQEDIERTVVEGKAKPFNIYLIN